MQRHSNSIATTTAWLAMASVLLQSLAGHACECDCHASSNGHSPTACHQAFHVHHGENAVNQGPLTQAPESSHQCRDENDDLQDADGCHDADGHQDTNEHGTSVESGGGDDEKNCRHPVLTGARDVKAAQCPASNRCPECRSSHETPTVTPVSVTSQVVRDERLNTLETSLDAGLFSRSLDVVRRHDFWDSDIAGISAQSVCALFCRFTI